jgi:predicted nucleic acid-binding Zn ribbon protein
MTGRSNGNVDNTVDTVDNSGAAGDADLPRPSDVGNRPFTPHSSPETVLSPGDGPTEPPVAAGRRDTPQPDEQSPRVPDPSPNASGADLAREALRSAQRSAAARGIRPGAPVKGRWRRGGRGARRRGWSGARPDDRDPQPLGRLAARLVADQGWQEQITSASVFGRWAELVGADIAEHATPVSLREGELTVQAVSTAWSTQLRLLQRDLLARITAGVGKGVVTRLRVHGPAAPSWRHGNRHVPGRGPRDTYG